MTLFTLFELATRYTGVIVEPSADQPEMEIAMLTCQQYDYIEIACMYRYPTRLHLKNGETVEGTAIDTCRNEQQQECIELESDGGLHKIVLDQLTKLEVLIANPNFQEVYF